MTLNIRTCLAVGLACVAGTVMGQTVKSITVKGNHEISSEAILAAMRTRVGQPSLRETLDGDQAAIERMGFFQKVDVSTQNDEIVVMVEEWPVVKEVHIGGNKGLKTEEILKTLDIETGKIFNSRTVQPNVEKIRKLYDDRGMIGDVVDYRLLPGSPQTLDIEVIEATVHSISFQGNTKTRGDYIGRLVRTRAGDVFNKDDWSSDLRRLYATNWFKDVRTLSRQQEPGQLDLILDFKEADTRTIALGAAADPRSAIAGTLNVTETNYRGTGQSFGIGLTQGAKGGGGPSVNLDYGNPFLDRANTSLNVTLYSRLVYRFAGTGFGSNETPTNDDLYTERRTGGAIAFGRDLDDVFSASLAFRMEDVKTNDLRTDISSGFIQQDGSLAAVTVGLTRNRRDVDSDPSRGDWFRIEVEPGFSHIGKVGGDLAAQTELGDNAYVKSTAEYRAYYSPEKQRSFDDPDAPRKVFAFRARYGAIAGKVPFFEQFFAGGAATVRGYDEDRYWGKQTLLASLEYRHPLMDRLSVIGFVDYGGAWGGFSGVNEFTQSQGFQLNVGYGVGVSYRVPKLGPLRLDLGFDKYGNPRTHFQIVAPF